jgi:Caspase domain
MTKKALLIGNDMYPEPTDDLRAAVKEMDNWARILSAEFGFDKVTPLKDKPTRADVLRELRTLFTGAVDGDDLVVGFCGHGAAARGWKSDTVTNNDTEHALIVYAGEQPTGSLQHAAVTPSDFARILKEIKPPSGVRIALALDCCFAEGFGRDRKKYDAAPPIAPRVLFISDAVPGASARDALTFDAIKAMVADSTIADPIILAAARFDQPAHEVGPENDRRLLFSSKLQNLVETLFGGADLTYAGAIKAINPLSDVQCAVIAGNRALEGESVFGGFDRQIGNTPQVPEPAERTAADQPAAEAALPVSPSIAITAAGSLNVRLLGLVTLLNLPAAKLPYRNRLVAPYDNQAKEDKDWHHAFIEVADRDMYASPSVLPTHKSVRGGIVYSRWQLEQHRVTIANVADTGAPVERSERFQRHVPSLPVVTPTLDKYYARPEAYENLTIPKVFTAFFDLQCGAVDVDPRDLEKHRTHFKTLYTNKRTWGPEYTAISALLTIPLANPYAAIQIDDTVAQGAEPMFVFVNSDATIVFGNARDLDINGPGSGEGPRTHFLICYQLAPLPPADPGLPETVLVPINACTMTGWP